MSRELVQIIDSEGNPGRLRRKQADQYNARGRGHWEGDVFVFSRDAADYRHASVAASIRRIPCFDDGMASLGQVEGLPVAGDAIRLFMGKRLSSPAKEDRVLLLSVAPVPETFLSAPL